MNAQRLTAFILGLTVSATLVGAPATDSAQESAVANARDVLAAILKADPQTLKVVTVEPKTWSNSGLGCEAPGTMTLQVISEGYAVTLQTPSGEQRLMHVSGKNVIECTKKEVDDRPPKQKAMQRPSRNLGRLIERARADLAEKLGVPRAEVKMASFAPATWRDRSMDCEAPAASIAAASIAAAESDEKSKAANPVKGYRLFFSHDGRQYTYHTDLGRVQACPPIETQ